jgi:phosphatidate cytidylyltransferase
VGVPAAVGVLWAGGWVLGVILALVAALCARELYQLAERGGARPFHTFGVFFAAGLVLLATATGGAAEEADFAWPAVRVLVLVAAGAAIWLRGVEGRPLSSAALTVFGAVFVGSALSYAVLLRHMDLSVAGGAGRPAPWAGAALLAFPIALTWIGDSAAYFGGRAWGTTKLIPRVSPGKTRAGALASLLGTAVVGAVYAAFVFQAWHGIPVGIVAGAVGGALISVVAQLGDLVESLFKREAGVKDSGTLLPGHGGALDRFDSLLFSIPVAYWYLSWVLAIGGGAPWR